MSRAYETEALQYEDEIAEFVELVRSSNIKSYLEVGAKFGGSLWRIAQALQPGSRIVVVDLPHGTIKWEKSKVSLEACLARLEQMGHETHLIWGDSTKPDVVQQVRALGPFDLALIDANHTMPYLEKDWENYGEIARLVAFHDISWHRPADWPATYSRIDVPQFWQQIRDDYPYKEIKLDPTGRDNGIGVLWRS